MYAQTASAYNFTLASLIVKLDVLSKKNFVACWKILLVQDQLSLTLTHRIAHFCVHPCGEPKTNPEGFPIGKPARSTLSHFYLRRGFFWIRKACICLKINGRGERI